MWAASVALIVVVVRRLASTRVTYPSRGWRSYVLGTFDGTLLNLLQRHRDFARLHHEQGASMVRVLRPLCTYVAFFHPPNGAMPKWYTSREADSDRAGLPQSIRRSLLGLPMGHAWGVHRRLVAPLFSAKHLAGYTDVVNELCTCSGMTAAPSSSWPLWHDAATGPGA